MYFPHIVDYIAYLLEGNIEMSLLIKKLKMDHAEISDVFREIVAIGVTSEEGKKKLIDAKATLLAVEKPNFFKVALTTSL